MKPLIPLAVLGVVGATSTASQNPLEVLGTTLGLTALAGVDLYLTVFVTGLAIQMGWLTNYPPALQALGEPRIIILSGVFYALEFFADKVPWVDSMWDAIHTFIRPIGGAFLAIKSLGTTDPMLDVVAGLLGGSVAFCTHSTKAGTRILVNHSPEPFSNIAVSVAEDVGVAGALWLTFAHPVLMSILVLTFLMAFIYFGPKVIRILKAEMIWIVSRIRSWLGHKVDGRLKWNHQEVIDGIAHYFADKAPQILDTNERLTFAIPCVSGRMQKIGRFTRGVVVGTSSGRLWFLGRKNFSVRSKLIPIEGASVECRRRFLFDELVVRTTGEDGTISLRFGKHYGNATNSLADWLRVRHATVEPIAAGVELFDPSIG
jgi:hypothetical protein